MHGGHLGVTFSYSQTNLKERSSIFANKFRQYLTIYLLTIITDWLSVLITYCDRLFQYVNDTKVGLYPSRHSNMAAIGYVITRAYFIAAKEATYFNRLQEQTYASPTVPGNRILSNR